MSIADDDNATIMAYSIKNRFISLIRTNHNLHYKRTSDALNLLALIDGDDVMKDVTAYCESVIIESMNRIENDRLKLKLANVMYYSLSRSSYDRLHVRLRRPVTMYEQGHTTAHVACDLVVARRIMDRWPARYVHRPFEHPFFDEIESMLECDFMCDYGPASINICDLFASIWRIVNEERCVDSDAKSILISEIDDAVGVCVSGHVSRLLNSVRAFVVDDEFRVLVDDYRVQKARMYYRFNKFYVDEIDVDKISDCVYDYDMSDDDRIDDASMLNILKEYTQQEWKLVEHPRRFIPA